MTPFVAILTLSTAAAAASAAPPPITMDGVTALEHLPLPAVEGPLTLRVQALDSRIVLESPHAAELARAIQRAPRSVCPTVETTSGAVRLRCRSRRIVAHLARREHGSILEIRETKGLPWDGEDGPILLPFDDAGAALDAESTCPDRTPSARGECLLVRNDRAAAQAAFALADAAGDAQAALRLGDLAYARGEVRASAAAWGRVRGDPWQRVAAARMCELSWKCLAAGRLAELYDPAGTPAGVARDLTLRMVRALTFTDRSGQAVELLLGTIAGRAACAAAAPTCRRLVLEALRSAPPASTDALGLWLELPARDRGPLAAYAIEREAARVAAEAGAPNFAANLLAAAVDHAPAAELDAHLVRTAELYLEGGDRVRAGVVLEFARTRAGGKTPPGARWAAVARGLAGRKPKPAEKAAAPARADGLQQLLAEAAQATDAARALAGAGGKP